MADDNDEMREIIQDFITESRETLENLDRSFIELENAPDDPDLINSIFRAMHTIKGAAGFLSFGQLVTVAHKAENVLNKIRQGELKLDKEMTAALLRAVDMIKLLLCHIEAGDGAEEDLTQVVGELEAVMEQLPSAPPAGEEKVIGEILVEEKIVSQEAVHEALDIQSQVNLKVGEILIEKGDLNQEGLQTALEKQKAYRQASEQTIRVDTKRLDSVLDLVGELVLGRNRLSKLAYRLEEKFPDDELVSDMVQNASFMDLVTSDLQMAVMKTRMQPIRKVFNKFPRMVWDLAKACGKEVEFDVRGEETELDKSVIEEIGDPLVHLLRNSVDHGIEMPDERAAAGKPPQGRVRLSAGYEGNHVIITLSDDGKGIDIDAVKAKAVQSGSFTEAEAGRLGEKEALDLIFMPGLSTAKKVSDVSGRGVGMDVVKNNITRLKGSVDVESARGRGTTMTVRLPLTVAILQALMVKVGGENLALPLSAVSEIIRVSPAEITTLNGREVVNKRDRAISVVRLDREFGLRKGGAGEGEWRYLIVLSMRDGRIGLLVDGLNGQEEIVIKSMGETGSSAKGIAGATITGDGDVVLVLDIEVLIKDMIEVYEGAGSAV